MAWQRSSCTHSDTQHRNPCGIQTTPDDRYFYARYGRHMTFIKATAGCQLAQVMHRKPDSRLAEHVSSIAVLDGRSAEHPDRVFVLPDGRSTLLFNLHHLHRSVIGAGAVASHLQSSGAVLGPASRS